MAAMETDEVSLPQALAAVQASFADAPTDAQAARQWAEGRGYDWGESETLLAQFLQGEARCETLRKTREHKKGEAERAGVQARANALAAELGCTEPLDTADALAYCEKVVQEKGASNLTAGPPSQPPAAELKKLEAIHDALRTDFALRRRMLLTRCDVTMQSFLWGDAAEGREQTIVDSVYAERASLSTEPPPYSVQDALATSKQRIDRMESALATPLNTKDQQSAMKTVIIGAVPSRGGNIRDKRPSQKDIMPSWKKREESTGKGGKGGRGRGKGGRGCGRGGGRGGGKKKKQKKGDGKKGGGDKKD